MTGDPFGLLSRLAVGCKGKQRGGEMMFGKELMNATDVLRSSLRANAHESVRTTEQPAWDGKGLPPVGAVVEVIDGGAFDSREGRVQAIVRRDGSDTPLLSIGSILYVVDRGGIRPIRTEEEKAVSEMFDVALKSMWHRGEERIHITDIGKAVKAIYAAGYRKTNVE